ncbi:MAG: PAS domain S-box protein, partial [Desulfosarcinaceae bacterium]|nr:PAS domain S-box protein [Desulfosarcinaceae bacterium]
MLMQLSNKIRYMVIGALIVPCFGRIALHNTGHEHEYYRFLVPLFIGAVAGYLIGLMKDRWMALNDDLIQTNADLEAKIRAQKETEAALQESEARYRSLFDNNHSAMLLVHPETAAIVDANPAAVAYYGWAREVFRQKRLTEFTPLVRDEIRDIMASAKREEQQRFIAAQTLASGERR